MTFLLDLIFSVLQSVILELVLALLGLMPE